MYRIDPSQVRDAASGDLLTGLVGQTVQVVARDTTTSYPIYTSVGDPILGSQVTVTRAIETPTVWIDADDPAGVFIDWYDPSTGVRGAIPFEAVSRAAATAARQAAEAAATAATTAAAAAASLAAGAVRVINGVVPDSDGKLVLDIGGGGAGGLVLDVDADLPLGLPAWTVVHRVDGGPGAPPDEGIELVMASLSETRGTGTSVTLTTPSGVADGDLLVAVLTHQNGYGPGWMLPAGWQVLHRVTDAQEPDARLTAIVALPLVSAANVLPSYTFTTGGGAGRFVATIFRVTGANLGAPIIGVSAVGAKIGAAQYATPSVTAAAGTLGILVYTAQILTPTEGVPTAVDVAGWDRVLDRGSVDGTTVTRTTLSVYARVLTTAGIPAVTATWDTTSGASGVGARSGIAVAIAPVP